MSFKNFLKHRDSDFHEEITGSAVAVPATPKPAAPAASPQIAQLDNVVRTLGTQIKQFNNPAINTTFASLQNTINSLKNKKPVQQPVQQKPVQQTQAQPQAQPVQQPQR